MTRFQHLADELACDEVLCELSDEQLEAIVDLLALTIHADERVSPIEVAAFNTLVLDMPWAEERGDFLRGYIDRSVRKVRDSLQDEGARQAIVAAAAERLEGAELREKVFLMAATLAGVDREMHPQEVKSLAWLAAAFGIAEDTAKAIAERPSRP